MLVLELAVAAEPLLGPDGWQTFGPLPVEAGSPRGWVVFDPRDCAVEVGAVDLDGGPGLPGLRVARVWTGGRWEQLDDLRIGEWVERPGRERRRAADLALETGPDRFREEGAWTELLRDPTGALTGFRRGAFGLLLGPDGAEASDGRNARYSWSEGQLVEVVDEYGRRTRYEWEGRELRGLSWADGAKLAFGPGRIDGPAGRWTCTADGETRRIVAPGGPSWSLALGEQEIRVTDADGVGVKSYWAEGRLLGWDDPRGGRTRLEYDGEELVVQGPDGSRWRRQGARPTELQEPGGSWRLSRREGLVEAFTDPSGRRTNIERDAEGWIVRHGTRSAWTTLDRDEAGRVVAIRPPSGGQVRLGRDGGGRVVRLSDGSGAAWSLPRDDAGRVRAIADPGGARWEIRRDSLGRPLSVKEPDGRVLSLSRRDDDRVEAIRVGEDRWEILRSPSGAITGLRDPLGHLSGWSRSPADRVRALRLPDSTNLNVGRDAAGDLVSVGDLRVVRDAFGRPTALGRGEGLVWARDEAGRVVAVEGPGVHLGFGRDEAGRIEEARVAGVAAVRLQRDAAGRVSRAEGEIPVSVERDAGGRISGLRREPGEALRLERDLRGGVSAVRVGERRWRLGRDAGGRVVDAEGPGGLRLGVARDEAGDARLLRLADGSLAELARSHEAVDLVIRDGGGQVEGTVAWVLDPAGAPASLRSALAWTLRRDPLGALTALEASGRAWARAADSITGPEGALVRFGPSGRPKEGRAPEGLLTWTIASSEIAWLLDEEGGIREVAGSGGTVKLLHDGLGRLLGWSGGPRPTRLSWDALGRLAAVDGDATDGWEGLFAWGEQARLPVAGAAVARPGGGVILGPRGLLAGTFHAGGLDLAPSGLVLGPAAGETGCGGRMVPVPGGPLIGGADALDPLSGQPTAARWALPWRAAPWECGPALSPWADPDGAAAAWWDDAPWAPESPWQDPLALLAGAGLLPASRAGAEAPGLGWLPASMAPIPPAGLPDGAEWPREAEPEVAWVLRHLLEARPARPEELVGVLFGPELAELKTIPGVEPRLPPGLQD